MLTPKPRAFLLAAFSIIAIGACGSHSDSPAAPAACHVAAASPSCGAPPANLADVDLSGGGFFRDVYGDVGLAGRNGVVGDDRIVQLDRAADATAGSRAS